MHYRIGYSSAKAKNPSVYIEYNIRKPGKKNSDRVIVKRCGKKLDLLAQDPLAFEKIQKEVDELNAACEQRKLKSSPTTLATLKEDLGDLLKNGTFSKNAKFDSRCAGLLILRALYDELNLDYKMDYLARNASFKYDLAKIVQDLVLLRILLPASKLRSSIAGPEHYLGFTSDNPNHMYKALDVLCENKDSIVTYINKQLGKKVPDRDVSVCLYDITTYAFQSTDQDALRDFGYSKDKMFNEVQVVMALATDQQGLPLDYSLFPGNQGEGATMIPFVSRLKKKFKVANFIVVADKGLNNKANLDALLKLGNDYVLSSKIRGASAEIKALALDPEGRLPLRYVDEDGVVIEYGWYKEIVISSPLKYAYPEYAFEEGKDKKKLEELKKELNHETTKSGKTVKSEITRRYIVTWTKGRDAKDKKDRERLLKKALKLIEKPSDLKAGFKRGGRSYVCVDMDLDKVSLDTELIEEQAKFDGIHVVETSLSQPASEVLEIYANLWRIENSFRCLKSTLQARPIFVHLPDHVRGHFLICYIALCVQRYLEYKLNSANKHATVDQIVHGLNSAQIALINPMPEVEFYGTTGFTGTVKQIMTIAGLKHLDTYEDGPALRRKLKVMPAMRELFSTT